MKKLTDFGLSEKQSKIYMAALQLSKASVQMLARKAGLERTNAYDAIEILVEKGLLSVAMENKKRYFKAEAPSILGRLLEEQQKALANILPELERLHQSGSYTPRVMFYPGIEGYRTAYEDTLTSKEKKLFGIFSTQDAFEVLGYDTVDRIIQKRIKKDIELRVVRSRERESSEVTYPSSRGQLRELRFAPLGMVFPLITYVYDDKVVYLSSKKETFGLIIQSHDIAQAHRNYFEALWRISTPTKI